MIFQLKPPNEQYEYNLPLCCIVIRLDASTIHFQKPVWNKWDAKSPAKFIYLFTYFSINFSVGVVRRKAVAIATRHLQIQSFVTGKSLLFYDLYDYLHRDRPYSYILL